MAEFARGKKIKARQEVEKIEYQSADEAWEEYKEQYFQGSEAAMVIMEARENIQFLLIFLTPCFRVYQIVLGLMIFSLFLVT